MKREHTNKIRFILEEILPPVFRDSLIFKFIIAKIMKNSDLVNFKSNIINISQKKYENIYKNFNSFHKDSDLSKICINKILKNIVGNNVVDVGCGNGMLLKKISKKFPKKSLTGIEMNPNVYLKKEFNQDGIKLFKLKIEKIDKIKYKYDTVICTHVLEHILDINKAYNNLKKICKDTLIIIVPKERPYKHSNNTHLHFFPYEWSFINTIRPINKFKIQELDRDFLYIERIKK